MRAAMRHVVVLYLSLVSLPDSTKQQNYGRGSNSNYGTFPNDPNYYDRYYKYTHNKLPSTGYYGYAYQPFDYAAPRVGVPRPRYDDRTGAPDYGRSYYGYRYPSYNTGYNMAYDGYGWYYHTSGGRPRDGDGWGRRHDCDYTHRYPVPPVSGGYDRFNQWRKEPFPGKYLGLGSVQRKAGREVELRCDFSQNVPKIISDVQWAKELKSSSFRASLMNFYPSGSIYQDIDLKNKRFFADMHGTVAVLHIYDVLPEDFGLYRCSAAQLTPTVSKPEFTYRTVEYFW